VLGDHLSRVLERGELRLRRQGASFAFAYYDQDWPAALPSLDELLSSAAHRCASDALAFLADALEELAAGPAAQSPGVSVADSQSPLSPAAGSDARSRINQRRQRRRQVLQSQLDRLLQEDLVLAAAVDAEVAAANYNPAALGALLDRQYYRLAFWRVAREGLGYRRFFDINTLVGVRVEDPVVFDDTHRRVREWLSNGTLDGVRIDHPDGLRDPEGYFQSLRELAPNAWVVVEKILEPALSPAEGSEEQLPHSWPVAGTTGYDFLNRVGGLFVDPEGEAALSRIYEEFTGQTADYARAMREKKLMVVRQVLGSDLNRLVDLLGRICRQRRLDYTRAVITAALEELVAAFPVYRTYVRLDPRQVSEDDVHHIAQAVETARAHHPNLNGDLLDFIQDLLLLRLDGELEGDFALRFQQYTGPAMAKGVEDTLFYTFNRLVSLNEVGGNPGRFGFSPEEFHQACARAQEHWPQAMLATSTHDTKRGEDVRARIHLLSEISRHWEQTVRRWAEINQPHRVGEWPDRNTEYFFYQTLVGAWPLSTERAVAYLEKASREAKAHTSWTDPDPAYDAALRSFVEATLADPQFTGEVEAFVAPLVHPARVSSLAQTLIKLTAPGIPDIYRGSELWDLNLVDPDNRRPVDFDQRRRLLAQLDAATPESVLARMDEGLPKLWVIQRALARRRQRPELFGPSAGYRPLPARGRKARHVVAFARGEGALTVAPRLVLGLDGDWADTSLDLPPGRWRDEFSGREFFDGQATLPDLLSRFPVALLSQQDAP
jgi:(1->4)-alpha-D-glucan 1-alpha-D-glucosylmutase